MSDDFSLDIEKAVQDLLKGPALPEKEFSTGTTFAEVYAMAANLHTTFRNPKYHNNIVCLAAENKAIIAAALLASSAGGPPLLLPYAFSAKVLCQAQQLSGFTTAISDVERDFPEDVKVISPQPEDTAEFPVETEVSTQAELLRIFTGGSTGSPQVWSKTTGNIFSEGFFLANSFDVSEHDCILATIPPYHIYGLLFSVVLPLVSSATVIEETPSFPGDILDIAQELKASILVSVPPHYRVLQDKKIPLRLAFSSAGMLDSEVNNGFCAKNPCGIVEVYGSTETGGIATRNRSNSEEYFTPFSTVDWQICNQHLAVRSPYISPDLTVDKDGFFMASDLVKAREKNDFSLEGRADRVTKVGGKRVDLEEISRVIKDEFGVADCVVMALPDSSGREHQINALIQGAVTLDTIRKTLTNSFEPYAQPRRLKTVKQIPVKKNGKYDWPAIIELLET